MPAFQEIKATDLQIGDILLRKRGIETWEVLGIVKQIEPNFEPRRIGVTVDNAKHEDEFFLVMSASSVTVIRHEGE